MGIFGSTKGHLGGRNSVCVVVGESEAIKFHLVHKGGQAAEMIYVRQQPNTTHP